MMNYRCEWKDSRLVLDIVEWNEEKWREVMNASPCETVGYYDGFECNNETAENEYLEQPVLRRDIDVMAIDGLEVDVTDYIRRNSVFTYDVTIGEETLIRAKELDIEILDRGEEEGYIRGFLGMKDDELVGRETLYDGKEDFFERKDIEVVHIYTHDGKYHHFWKIDGNKAVDGNGECVEVNHVRTYDEALADYKEECARIAEDCEAEGYPSYGSNYDLRVAGLREYYPEIFGEDE